MNPLKKIFGKTNKRKSPVEIIFKYEPKGGSAKFSSTEVKYLSISSSRRKGEEEITFTLKDGNKVTLSGMRVDSEAVND